MVGMQNSSNAQTSGIVHIQEKTNLQMQRMQYQLLVRHNMYMNNRLLILIETRGDDIERKICPEPENISPDIEDCDESSNSCPVTDIGTDSNNDDSSSGNNKLGSKVQCWNEFDAWLTYGDPETNEPITFDSLDAAISKCDQLGATICQGILTKVSKSGYKLR